MCDTAATATYTHKVPDATVGVTQAVVHTVPSIEALTNEEAKVRSITPTALTQSYTTFVSDTSGYVGAVVPDSLQTGGQNRLSRIDYFSAITLYCYNKDPNCIRIGKALRGAFCFLEYLIEWIIKHSRRSLRFVNGL